MTAAAQQKIADPVRDAYLAAHAAREVYPTGHVFSMTRETDEKSRALSVATCECGVKIKLLATRTDEMDAAIEAHWQRFDHEDDRGQPLSDRALVPPANPLARDQGTDPSNVLANIDQPISETKIEAEDGADGSCQHPRQKSETDGARPEAGEVRALANAASPAPASVTPSVGDAGATSEPPPIGGGDEDLSAEALAEADDIAVAWPQYSDFLERKILAAPSCGFAIDDAEIDPLLRPHQRAIVKWAVAGGRRAMFASFGLGKTFMQLEAVRLTLARTGGRGLIVIPLGVRGEFFRDAATLGIDVKFIKHIEEAGARGIYLTNYETVRDRKLDPAAFSVISLDEASILRGFGGTKTFREFMAQFAGDARIGAASEIPYRFVATATPSPNDYIELLAYAAFLGIMDVGQAKTRFFQRNSEKSDDLTLYPHKEREFWSWVASFAVFLQSPADLGFDDAGYVLPPMRVNWHEVPSDHSKAGAEKDGQTRLFRNAAASLSDAAKERRDNLEARVAKMVEIIAADPEPHRLLWHDLEIERGAIAKAVPDAVAIWGSQDLEEREQRVADFSDGKIKYLAAKPVLAGSGCNFQRHCHKAIFLGVGYKFNDFIQACHRIQRFLQTRDVEIDIIYSEAERDIRAALEAKWARHVAQAEIMRALIRRHGLATSALADELKRSIGCRRREETGERFSAVNADCVEETAAMAADSVDLVVTSIPFEEQYEYTPSYNDFGHTDGSAEFWRQMGFLTPQLHRVLKPGRVCAIHVKDRITPGGINGFGFQTVKPVSDYVTAHFCAHGFGFLARIPVITDVVRENNQTYRLGWTEQCKDGSKMGAGQPEYVMVFRKPPSDRSNGYADEPVTKQKPRSHTRDGAEVPYEQGERMIPGTGYSRSRWQIDAHGFWRSNGNRFVEPEDLCGMAADAVWKLWRQHSLAQVYEFEHHVACCEAREARKELPKTFFLMPPHSWHPDVWTDIARMRTLNMLQERRGAELHLCPLQFDIVDRLIERYSNPGDLVFDPFGGIGTVPYRALLKGRRGAMTELSGAYFLDAVHYLRMAEEKLSAASLFDLAAFDQVNTPPTALVEAGEQ